MPPYLCCLASIWFAILSNCITDLFTLKFMEFWRESFLPPGIDIANVVKGSAFEHDLTRITLHLIYSTYNINTICINMVFGICSHSPSCPWRTRVRRGCHLQPASTTPKDRMVPGYWGRQLWTQPTQEQGHRKCPEQCGLQQSTGKMISQEEKADI